MSFHLVEHTIDYHRKLGEGIVGCPMRQPFTKIAGNDALNSLVYLYNTAAGSGPQRQTDRKANRHSGNQAKRKRAHNGAWDILYLIGISSNH